MPDLKKLYLHLTDQCNLKCRHCYIKRHPLRPSLLNWEQIRAALSYFGKSGFRSLNLTGGEPFLSPFFEKTLKQTKKTGFTSVAVSTSGYLPDRIKKLDRSLVNTLVFSVDGFSELSHDFVRGRGSFKRCLESIKIAIARGFTTQVVFTVNNKNIDEINQTALLLDRLGVNRLSLNFTSFMGNARRNPNLLITAEQWRKVLKNLEKVKGFNNLTLRIPYRFLTKKGYREIQKDHYCNIEEKKSVFVLPNGQVFYCCLLTNEGQYASGRISKNGKLTMTAGEEKIPGFSDNNVCPAQYYLSHKDGRPEIKRGTIPACIYFKKIILPN